MPLLERIPLLQLKVLTRRSGLDLQEPANRKDVAKELSKDTRDIFRLESNALVRLALMVDKESRIV